MTGHAVYYHRNVNSSCRF